MSAIYTTLFKISKGVQRSIWCTSECLSAPKIFISMGKKHSGRLVRCTWNIRGHPVLKVFMVQWKIALETKNQSPQDRVCSLSGQWEGTKGTRGCSELGTQKRLSGLPAGLERRNIMGRTRIWVKWSVSPGSITSWIHCLTLLSL